jgi:outer membrane receptor protein involved in Fe transport
VWAADEEVSSSNGNSWPRADRKVRARSSLIDRGLPMKTCLFTAASIAALAVATSAAAQSAAAPDVAVLGVDLSDVVVSATRSPQAIERIGASVTVLNEADIRDNQAVNLVDLITRTPAVSVTRNGGVDGSLRRTPSMTTMV